MSIAECLLQVHKDGFCRFEIELEAEDLAGRVTHGFEEVGKGK